jgi:hypothetical protein
MVKSNCIPNKHDVSVVKICKKLTRRQWVINNENTLYQGIHFKKISDQQKRAEILLDQLLFNKLKSLCLMDGHGRFLYQILYLIYYNIKYKILKNLKIFVCEIDSESHKYHKKTFPKNVKVIKEDIFKIANKYNDKHTIFYYNFCSFGKNYNYIIENVIREINKNHLIMITFHVRRADYLYKFANLLDNISNHKTGRSNTFSWFIPRQNNNYIKLSDYIFI